MSLEHIKESRFDPENGNPLEPWECPCCNRVTNDHPAISRGRLELYICSACGSREALEDYYSAKGPGNSGPLTEGPSECPGCGSYRRRKENDYLCWECRLEG